MWLSSLIIPPLEPSGFPGASEAPLTDTRLVFSEGLPNLEFRSLGSSPKHCPKTVRAVSFWVPSLLNCKEGWKRASQMVLVVKNPPDNARDLSSIPGLGRPPGAVHGNLLQYSCLENPVDGRASWIMVYRAAQSWAQLK